MDEEDQGVDTMNVNRSLFWECDVRGSWETWDDFSRGIYVERVLTWGSRQDLHDLGFRVIREYLPRIRLPKRIKEFWESYFAEEKNHVDSHGVPEADPGACR